MIAHVGLWPGLIESNGARRLSIHPIDWYADPRYPGVGSMVMRHVLEAAPINMVIGGSAVSQALFPTLGLHVAATMKVYSRLVRPWKRHAMDKQASPFKRAARLIRDTMASVGSLPEQPAGWTTAAVDDELLAFERRLEDSTSADHAKSVRTIDSLRYLLKCPHSSGRLAYLAFEGQVRGYFLLNTICGQCKIADLFIRSDRSEDWRAAYSMALLSAIDDESTREVIAATSLPSIAALLPECGLRLRRQKPIFIADHKAGSPDSQLWSLQLADSDALCYTAS